MYSKPHNYHIGRFTEQANGEDELEIWESEDDMEEELDEKEQTSFSTH